MRSIRAMALLVLLGFSSVIFSFAQLSPAVEQQVGSARSALLQMRLAEADSLLATPGSTRDERSILALNRAAIPFMRVLLADRGEDYESFFERSDAVRKLVRRPSNSSWLIWIAGESELQRAFVWAKKGDYIRAALAANAAYQFFEKAHEIAPEFEEPYKGLGLMHLAIGALPGRFRKALRILGYRGSLEEGLRELDRAAEKSQFNAEEALILMATVDKYGFPSPRLAVPTYATLWHQFEGSPLIGLLYADALIRGRAPSEALDILRRSETEAASAGTIHIDYLDYYTGEALFRLNDCSGALQALKTYYTNHEGPSLKLTTALMIGQCSEIMGDRVGATAWYAHIVDSRGFAEEGAALRKASVLIADPMTESAFDLLRANNHFDSGKSYQADSLYRSVLNREALPSALRMDATYGIARVLHETGREGDALEWYAKVAGMIQEPGADPLAKWIPFSLMHSALILAGEGDASAAEEMLDQLARIKGDYDFKSTVQNRSRIIREELEL